MTTALESAQSKTEWLIETYNLEELRTVWCWYAKKIKTNESVGNMTSENTLEMFKLITQVGWAMSHPLSVAREEVKASVDHDALDRFNRARARLRPAAVIQPHGNGGVIADITVPNIKNFAPQTSPSVVPAGRYAIQFANGVQFFKVDRPTEGRWAGYTFVERQAGDETFPIRDRRSRDTILGEIAKDYRGAMELYGREIGSCGHCGRTLTNDESRARGIGPKCAANMGW